MEGLLLEGKFEVMKEDDEWIFFRTGIKGLGLMMEKTRIYADDEFKIGEKYEMKVYIEYSIRLEDTYYGVIKDYRIK